MGLLDKFFGNKDGAQASVPAASDYLEHDSDLLTEDGVSRTSRRRELVQVVLRDTMRKHGVPSDWIECRLIPALSRKRTKGVHVQLVVRKAHDQLLGYVFAFQESFLREIAQFEPRADDWLFSIGWQFKGSSGHPPMPDPKVWSAAVASTAAPQTEGQKTDVVAQLEEEIEQDLKALFAIRDAALKDASESKKRGRNEDPDFEDTQPSII